MATYIHLVLATAHLAGRWALAAEMEQRKAKIPDLLFGPLQKTFANSCSNF